MSYPPGQPPQGYQGKPGPGFQQQPQAIQPMTVGGGNRNANNLPIGPNGRPWSYGLCDCFADASTCIVACFCPCIVFGQVKRRHTHLSQQGTPDPQGGELFSGDCLIHALLLHIGCAWIWQTTFRGEVRQRYNVEGDGFMDCVTSCCCTPCQLTQESREIELEERSFGGPLA